MKRNLYLLAFLIFCGFSVLTAIKVNEKLIHNEDAIMQNFLNTNAEEILANQPEEFDEDYEKETDARRISSTQTVKSMLQALDVSADDIAQIGQLISVDKLKVEKGSYIKMHYRDDIDEIPEDVSIHPFYPKASDRVRNIQYLSFPIEHTRYIFKKPEDKITLQRNKIVITNKPVFVSGKVNGSLYDSFMDNNVPSGIFQTFVNIYSYDIDFQRDLRAGDTFGIVYDAKVNDEGAIEGIGKVLYTKLGLKKSKKDFEYFAAKRDSSSRAYYDRKGRAALKAFMRTPVNGARISSKFGLRRHPILGYSKLHTGTDFAAPSGTAIYAAADGIITFIDWNGGPRRGYGRYTVIKHNNTYSTAYAHQLRFAPKLQKGSKVRQGQVIGYVGSTGYSTGAHLHYEVIKNGEKINPSGITSFASNEVSPQDRPSLMSTIRLVDDLVKASKKR